MSDEALDQMEFEIGLTIGAVTANFDISQEDCAKVLEDAAAEVRSGRYDAHFDDGTPQGGDGDG